MSINVDPVKKTKGIKKEKKKKNAARGSG